MHYYLSLNVGEILPNLLQFTLEGFVVLVQSDLVHVKLVKVFVSRLHRLPQLGQHMLSIVLLLILQILKRPLVANKVALPTLLLHFEFIELLWNLNLNNCIQLFQPEIIEIVLPR